MAVALRTSSVFPHRWLGAVALVATGLAGCSTFDEAAAPAPFQPVACCGQQLTALPDQGLLRPGQVAQLGPASHWFELATGLAPVAAWQLPFPRGDAQLELVVPLQAQAEQRQAVPMLTVQFIDDVGQVVTVPVIGPRAEQASAPQLRWWVEVPPAAQKVIVGVDASEAGRMFTLNITEPGPSTLVSGIKIEGPAIVTPLALRASLTGRVQLRLLGA
jgi:hypothetical protein